MGVEFAVFPGVPHPVELRVFSRGKSSWSDIHENDPEMTGFIIIDDSRYLNRIFRTLKTGLSDRFSSLMRYGTNAGISPVELKPALEEFYMRGLRKYLLYGELSRLNGPGYRALYRGARVVGGRIGVDGISPVVLRDPPGGPISPDWREALDADEGTDHIPPNAGDTGDCVLLWNYDEARPPRLQSYVRPVIGKNIRGALRGRVVA